MEKKPWIIGIITILLCILLYLSIDNARHKKRTLAAEKQRVQMEDVLGGIECEWLQKDINSWAVVGFEDTAIGELEDMAYRASEFFDLLDSLNLSSNHDQGIKQVILKGRDNKGLLYDIIITNSKDRYNKQGRLGYETHVIVNILDNQYLMDTQVLRKKIGDYFHSINAVPHISTTFTGAFQGQLNKKQKKFILEDLIKEIEGRPTQTMEDGELISMAGYSPIIDTNPMDNINFQVALRYNGYRNKTYLWIGTPIITIEY